METLGILIEYDYDEDEIEGMKIGLQETDNESTNNWIGGLHYGKKDVLYIKLAHYKKDTQMVYIFISGAKNLESQVKFIDLLQNNYSKIIKK